MKDLYKVFCILLSSFLLVGCVSKTAYAPVVDAWSQPTAKRGYYRVRKGDTLYSIAWSYGLDYRAVAAANNLSAPYHLWPGQQLKMTAVPRKRFVRSKHRVIKVYRHKPRIVVRQISTAPPSWRWPARGKVIERFSNKAQGNKGINIAGVVGEPVRAAASGRVVYSGSGVRGYGNLIIIKHNSNYLSAYAFNKKILVQLGRRVKVGQKIAVMGHNNSGHPMLHFEIRHNGKPVNPLRYIKRG